MNLTSLNKFQISYYWKSNFNLFFYFLKESIIFIFFWLFNSLIPILICLIVAQIKNYGAYYVLGIGYITAFQLAYVQIGWVISIAITFATYKYSINKLNHADYKQLNFNAFIMISTIGLGLIPLFLIPTYIYNYYANNHVNTIISQSIATNYIYGLLPYIWFNVILSFFIINIRLKHGIIKSILAMFFSNTLIIGVCALCTLAISYNTVELYGLMIGLSLSIGCLISIIILGFYLHFKNKSFSLHKINFKQLHILFKFVFKQIATILSIQIIKGIALIVLGIAISATMNMTSPMGYQLSRVVWYNYLYLIPFFAYGVGDAIMFIGLRKNIITTSNNLYKNIFLLVLFCLIIEIGISIGAYFTIEPLSAQYVKYQDINWSYIDLNRVDLIYTINYLSNRLGLTDTQLKQIENFINWCNSNLNNPFLGPIASNALNLFKQAIVQILSHNNMSGSGIGEYLMLPNKSYIYISIFGIGYSCALIINNITLTSKQRYSNIFESIFLIIMQIIVISGVVTMGVKLQSTSNRFPFLDAWSFPLAIAGIGSFILYIFLYKINQKKIQKNNYLKTFIKMNQWNNNKNDIIAFI